MTAGGELAAEVPGRGGQVVRCVAGCGSRSYGRVSTEDWQDPESSRTRQRDQAGALVRGHGQVVAGFVDEGQSRTVARSRRPPGRPRAHVREDRILPHLPALRDCGFSGYGEHRIAARMKSADILRRGAHRCRSAYIALRLPVSPVR